MSKTNIICVVSTRNDGWIMQNFLDCAKEWCDYVIVGDHNSKDGSVNIARQYDSVRVISHQASSSFLSRRRDLLNEARKIPGNRIIFNLDIDEMISANWRDSPDWDLILSSKPGSRFAFEWTELLPGLERATIFWMPAVFVDDGSDYPLGENIHESRLPGSNPEITKLYDIKLLHYILIDPGRIIGKHRYYKCYEYIEFRKRPWYVDVYYQDTKLKSYGAPLVSVKEEWLKGYDWLNKYKATKGIAAGTYWYDEEVLNYFDQFGVEKFRKLNIWDVDWNKKAELLNRQGDYGDPRSGYEVWVHRFIEKYREGLKMSPSFRFRLIRLFARTVLRVMGW